LPVSSSAIANPHVLDGLTSAERTYLWKNGFVIIHDQEAQFSSLRGSVDDGQPYFLTVDAAYHTLHQNFDDLLKNLEKAYLGKRMQAVLQATLAELFTDSAQWRGTPIESDATQSERCAQAFRSLVYSRSVRPRGRGPPDRPDHGRRRVGFLCALSGFQR
jgi:hypothetical protein